MALSTTEALLHVSSTAPTGSYVVVNLKIMFATKLPRFMRNPLTRLFASAKPQTIFALSSGQGKCGVAVIRASGADAGDALKQMLAIHNLPKPRYAHLKTIRHPSTKEVLDRGIVLWFPGPASFTGEDCFELQVHGGVAVVSAILNALGAISNLRLAKPGEFTKRAFFNGKLDLTEVEGLADLIHAETEAQRRQAVLQAQGFLSKIYNGWRDVLVKCVAHVEAYIDFDETDALESDVIGHVTREVERLHGEIERHLADGRKGELLRSGVRTVILGEPNVGKSSLLNVLCRRPAAIVTPVEGTTRDVLEVTVDVGGYPVVLMDTAGLRFDTEDVVEKEGINRALSCYQAADLVILLLDSEKFAESKSSPNEFLKRSLHALNLTEDFCAKEHLVVFNKNDLIEKDVLSHEFLSISCKTNDGLSKLTSTLAQRLEKLCGLPREHVSMNQARHREHLTDCLGKLNECLRAQKMPNYDTALLAEHLRVALRHLGKLTGAVTSEQLLDVIFKDFCIGK